ncbi:MAG: hypothetical protein DMG70_01460 [Acidobacteria bacterium]|nr:MAG: hypothetical protein DMG70_01460 [Acidobacteriota bacterium]
MIRRTSLVAKWKAHVREPFPLLVRLSMNRIFHGTNGGEEEGLTISMGLLLALLAIPGGFVSIFLFDKYGSFLQWLRGQTNFDSLAAALPDEYFFIVLSMVVTGGIAVWWWDSIFPDRRDFTNLAHLPIPASRIFLANSVAILILTYVCALDVNAASSILFPVIVGASQPKFSFMAQFAGVHALVVVLASIFSFFAVFATAGLLMLLLPYPLFRRISFYVRTLIATVLLATLSTSFAIPRMIRDLPRTSHSPLRFLPSAWFLGLCQLLRGRADRALAELGHVAMVALLSACAVAAAAYTLAYRRCFVRLSELADTPPGNLGTRTSWIFHLLDRLIFRTPFQRAGYRFVLKTLFRNEAHALALGGFLSLGVVFASQTLLSALNGKGISPLPTANELSIPLILGYCLLLGVRFVFDFPAYLQANWIFRFLLDGNIIYESIALARRVMLCFVAPWILLVAVPTYVYFWGWTIGFLHIGVLTLWLWLLTEVLLVDFHKLPFACAYPSFQPSAVVAMIAFVLGYFAFTAMTADLEAKALVSPGVGGVFLVISLGVWYAVYGIRRSVVGIDNHLMFEDAPARHFEFLHLSDDG